MTDFEEFSAFLVEQFGVDEDRLVNPAVLISDLGLDSLEIYELAVVLDTRSGGVISGGALPELRTLADALSYWQR